MFHVALQVINPPLFGVIAGVVVGLSPAGPLLFLAPSPSASKMPFELKIVVGKHCLYAPVVMCIGAAWCRWGGWLGGGGGYCGTVNSAIHRIACTMGCSDSSR